MVILHAIVFICLLLNRIMTMGMKLNYQQEIKEENINLQEFGALCFKRQIKQGRKEYCM